MRNQFKTPENYPKRSLISRRMQQRIQEGIYLILVACAIFLLISLISYQNSDHGWSNTGSRHPIQNWGGRIGACISDLLLSLFGIVAYLFSIIILLSCFLELQPIEESIKKTTFHFYRFLGWSGFILSSCALMHFYAPTFYYLPTQSGGIIGDILGHELSILCNPMGSTLFFIALLLCSLTLAIGISWAVMIAWIGQKLTNISKILYQKCFPWIYTLLLRYIKRFYQRIQTPYPKLSHQKTEPTFNSSKLSIYTNPPSHPAMQSISLPPEKEKKKCLNLSSPHTASKTPSPYPPLSHAAPSTASLQPHLPAYHLLNTAPIITTPPFSHLNFTELTQLVEQNLAHFGIIATVVSVLPGPVITRFELELAPGIKVSKITGLTKDIARSLSVISVRVVEVIPGKSVIGLEIPNEHRELVTLHDIISSPQFAQASSPVSLVLGKDISGHPIIVDLAKMPHLLVAGTTGSGKSVGLNAMLLSLLFKTSPQKLRFIMIDPKILELSIYDGIPHLCTPVITDMKDAAHALRWCVHEMDRRYHLMASLGVRHLYGYNQMIETAIQQGQPLSIPHVGIKEGSLLTQTHLEPLPIIAVIIDELADLMMVVGKKVEDYIARLAQKARAAGIHLIIATQRPSVDVITGLIKANIPTRIAFQVSSRIDSRTILDQQGAEQLLGQGDMLYLPPGAGIPIRVHGAYVADEEVHRVVAALRASSQPNYIAGIIASDETDAPLNDLSDALQDEQDPLYTQAYQFVIHHQKVSISLIQRRLRIGYNRAARLIETLETAGIVSTADSKGLREVIGSTESEE